MSDFKALFEESEKRHKAKDALIENQLKKITSLETSTLMAARARNVSLSRWMKLTTSKIG